MLKKTLPNTTHRKFTKKLLLVAIIISTLVVAFFVSPRFIYTKNIECYTQHGLCPDEWVKNLNALIDTPLLRPLPKSKVEHLLNSFSQIESFHLFRRLPSTLVVLVQLRNPLGMIGPNTQVLGVADEKGVIFSLSPTGLLPHLITDSSPQINQKLSDTQILALHALKKLTSFSKTQISGSLDHTSLSVQLTTSTLVIVDVKKDPKSWATPLQLILDRSKISPKVPARIDLRFTNPVISYN